MRRCCGAQESQRGSQKPPKVFLLAALTFLFPKCPLCIPGFMALLGALGLQIGFGTGLIFTLKCLAALCVLCTLLICLQRRRNADRVYKKL